MASFVAGQMGKSVKSDLTKEWSNAMHSVGLGRDRTNASAETGPTIDWTDFNYPPCIRLFHYSADELPSKVSTTCKLTHGMFLAHIALCILVIVDDFILACLGVGWFRFAYSILNFFLIIPAAGYTFYQGYKGLALSNRSTVNKYLITQLVLVAVDVLLMVLPYGGFNGVASLVLKRKDEFNGLTPAAHSFWTAVICYETICWLFCALLGSWCAFKVKTHNPYHSQEARATGV